MRLLLLSDTHGQLHPAILKLAQHSDTAVHAGDVGDPDILAQLLEASSALVVVRGNNDTPAKWPKGTANQLSQLPLQAKLDLPGGMLAVEHGDRVTPAARRHSLLRERHPSARLILYGHSHRQAIDASQVPWVVNPGAAGRNRTYGGAACICLTANSRRWRLKAYRFPLAGWKP